MQNYLFYCFWGQKILNPSLFRKMVAHPTKRCTWHRNFSVTLFLNNFFTLPLCSIFQTKKLKSPFFHIWVFSLPNSALWHRNWRLEDYIWLWEFFYWRGFRKLLISFIYNFVAFTLHFSSNEVEILLYFKISLRRLKNDESQNKIQCLKGYFLLWRNFECRSFWKSFNTFADNFLIMYLAFISYMKKFESPYILIICNETCQTVYLEIGMNVMKTKLGHGKFSS